MIKINLLPPELQEKKGRAPKAAVPARRGAGIGAALASLGAPVLILICAVVLFGAAGYGFYYVQAKIIGEAKEEAELMKASAKKARQEFYSYYVDYREKIDNYYRMKAQQEILNDLMPEHRLLWSEKLKMLSELVPEDVYVTDIIVKEEEEMVETEQSKERRAEYKAARAKIEATYKSPESAAESAEEEEEDSKGGGLSAADKKRMEQEIEKLLGPPPEVIEKPQITQILNITAVSVNERYADRYDKVLEFTDAMKAYSTTGRHNEVRRFMDFFSPEIAYSTMAEREIDGFTVWRFELELMTVPLKPEGA